MKFAWMLPTCLLVASPLACSTNDGTGGGGGPSCVTPSADQIDPGCFPDELGSGPITGTPEDSSEARSTVNVVFAGPFTRTIDGMACVQCGEIAPRPVDPGEFYNCDGFYRCGPDACRFHVTIGGFSERRWLVFGPDPLTAAQEADLPESCRPYVHGVWDLGAADIAPWVCEPHCTAGVCGDDGCGHACPCGSSGGGDGGCSACYDACAGVPGCSCCSECGVPCWND